MKTHPLLTSTLAATLLLPALHSAAPARTLPTIDLVEAFDAAGDRTLPQSINRQGDVAGYAFSYTGTPRASGFYRQQSGAVSIFAFEDDLTYLGGLNSSHTICGYYFTNEGARTASSSPMGPTPTSRPPAEARAFSGRSTTAATSRANTTPTPPTASRS